MPLNRSDSCLTLIVPQMSSHLAAQSFAGRSSVLARLAGRGSVQAESCDAAARGFESWQGAVLRSCGLPEDTHQFPSGPVSYLGETGELDRRSWAHLDCVHLAAGLNDLIGVELKEEAGVMREERAQLTATLQEHLVSEGCELREHGKDGWLLRFPRELQAVTIAPEPAFRGPLRESLPCGEDGAELRRLMTELQMLLHEHPVNVSRARRGVPAINALWLWGVGSLGGSVQSARALPAAYGQRDFLKGLYLMHGQCVRAQSFTLNSLLEDTHGDAIAVIEVSHPDALQSDWLEPLEHELRSGKVRRVDVHLDQWRICVSRGDLFRFWRKPRTPAQWSV